MSEAAPYLIGAGLTLVGLVVLLVGWSKWRKYRLILDTPTSKIRSMALGIVELHGEVQAQALIKTPFSQTDCVFYRYVIKEYRRHTSGSGKNRRTTYRWDTVSTGDQRVPFWAVDDSGTVLVDPLGAEVHVSRCRVFYQKSSGLSGFGGLLDFVKKLKDFSFSSVNEMDTTGWDLKEVTSKSGWSFGTRVGDRKYYEYFLLPDDLLFVLGTAANRSDAPEELVVLKGSNEEMFYISDQTEQDVMKSLRRKAYASTGGGVLLFVAGLVVLLFFGDII